MRIFTLSQIAPLPWRNGGGITREIASGRLEDGSRHDEGLPWDWRLSVALIASDGPFSTFVGIDRSAVLLDGRLDLKGGEGEVDKLVFERPGDVHRFAGESALQASLNTSNARLLNIMTRRGRVKTHVAVQKPGSTVEGGKLGCVLVAQGWFGLAFTDGGKERILRLNANQGALWRSPPGLLRIIMRSRGGCLVRVLLEPGLVRDRASGDHLQDTALDQ